MIEVIYAVILIIFWIRATRITPERYPNVDPDTLLTWQVGKLQDYRQYGGFLLIWIILALSNTALGNYYLRHPSTLIHNTYLGFIIFTIAVMVTTLTIIGLRAYRRLQWQRSHIPR